MNKELQDLAWSVLPKEFHEEVKKMFEEDKKHPEIHTTCGITTAYHNNMGQRLIDLFGLHNLTSDAEEEEMLTVPRKAIIQAYEKSCAKRATKYDVGYADCLYNLFGSKCLPDEGTDCTPVEVGVAENTTTSNVESLEPKSAEPKFHIGQRVRHILTRRVDVIEGISQSAPYIYHFKHMVDPINGQGIFESDLEPYTEQEVKCHVSVKEACEILGVDESEATKLVKSEPIETCTDDCSSPCSSQNHSEVKDKMVDKIIKDGFKNHNRLHIAAILAAGMLASEVRCYPVDRALELADALIAEAKK